MPNPYNLTEESAGIYSFITDHGFGYMLYSIDNTNNLGLGDFPCTAYTFGFDIKDESIKEIPYDVRVEATVVCFIVMVLSSKRNCVMYAGSPKDGKQAERIRLFDLWFARNRKTFDKIERHYRTTTKDNQAVLLIRSDCEIKNHIIQIFLS